MAITKAKKVEILKKIEDGLEKAESLVFVKFKGLPVKDTTEFRKKLREAGVTYYVAKKTLMKRVLDKKGYKGDLPALEGEIALAWSADPISAAKNVFTFAKTHKEQVMLVGGVYEGAYMSEAEIMGIATIPSREELLSKFVGMLNNSIGNVVRVINEHAKQLETTPTA